MTSSDSRSGQVIEDRVIPALDAGTGLASKKPVCVVIDEIDGATGAGDNVSLPETSSKDVYSMHFLQDLFIRS